MQWFDALISQLSTYQLLSRSIADGTGVFTMYFLLLRALDRRLAEWRLIDQQEEGRVYGRIIDLESELKLLDEKII